MRAVFTIQVPKGKDGKYLSNEKIRDYFRAYGWQSHKYLDLKDDEIEQKFIEFAKGLFKDMPEIAVGSAEEEKNVIFGGVLQAHQTRFVVTRRVDGHITFRVLHPDLERLLSSVTYIVKTLSKIPIGGKSLEIIKNQISIFERGSDETILIGRYIPNPFSEAINTNKKDLFLSIFPFVIFCILLIIPDFSTFITNSRIADVIKELPIILITTSLVSLLGFMETFLEIRRNRLLSWKISTIYGIKGISIE